ncbi:MAG: DNA double-strand break repair nuclease NurA [Pyrinomonadaceae bacterium]
MIFKELITRELAAKRNDFAGYFSRYGSELLYYSEVRELFERTPSTAASERLAGSGAAAFPSPEIDEGRSLRIDFDSCWANHEQARGWAAEVLSDRVTFAADGSQTYIEKETTLPVGAVQVGWFENPHSKVKKHTKEARFEILSPSDLLDESDVPMNPESRVGEKRFHSEIEKAAEFISRKKGWFERGERMPLAFFDGTLLVSFSLPQTSIQESFVTALVNLVRHSSDCRVPIVGYVDRSFARDIVSMLHFFKPRDGVRSPSMYDTAILNGQSQGGKDRVLRKWGDRTSFCYSRRRGLEAFIDRGSGRPIVGFTYLQTTADAQPARLDVPAWIYEDGMLEEVVDVVRAECVIGLGYPYALEAADQTALITARDKEMFLKALQDFAICEKLGFSISQKNASKARRR